MNTKSEGRTPEEKKISKANRAKAHAKEIYDKLIPIVFNSFNKSIESVTDRSTQADIQAIGEKWKDMREMAAEASFSAVDTFDATWKKKKGQWLNDNA